MKWYPLTTRDSLLLFGIFVISYLFTAVQRFFVPAEYRAVTYIAAVFVLFLAFFLAVKPERPLELAKFLSILIGAIVFAVVAVEALAGSRNISPENAVIVIGGAITVPIIAGFIYHFIAKRIRKR